MVGRGEAACIVSWLLLDPPELPGRRCEPCRTDSLDRMPVEAFRSWLRMLTPSLPAPLSRREPGSMCDWGKMPHLPLELVPDQHQCPGYAPEKRFSIKEKEKERKKKEEREREREREKERRGTTHS